VFDSWIQRKISKSNLQNQGRQNILYNLTNWFFTFKIYELSAKKFRPIIVLCCGKNKCRDNFSNTALHNWTSTISQKPITKVSIIVLR